MSKYRYEPASSRNRASPWYHKNHIKLPKTPYMLSLVFSCRRQSINHARKNIPHFAKATHLLKPMVIIAMSCRSPLQNISPKTPVRQPIPSLLISSPLNYVVFISRSSLRQALHLRLVPRYAYVDVPVSVAVNRIVFSSFVHLVLKHPFVFDLLLPLLRHLRLR